LSSGANVNLPIYERAGTVSAAEADAITALTRRLHADLLTWLAANHPHLAPEPARPA
jgi:hypothetical protein